VNILKLTHEDLVECERLDLTGKQFKALCILMGIPYSGVKQELVERLKVCSQMRIYLRDKTPEQLATMHKKPEIAEMSKSVGAFGYPYSRIGLAYRLIWWRDNCRRKGQQALGEARECVRKQRAERRRVRPELWEGTL